MDLEAARKSLSKRGTFSPRRVIFFVIAGLGLAAGILLRSGEYFTRTDVQQSAPVAVAPAPPPIAATPAVGATKSVPEVEQNSPAAIAPSPPLTAATPALGTTESVSPSSPPAEKVVTAPAAQTESTSEAVAEPEPAGVADGHAGQPELPDGGIILVARHPVEVLANPSSSSAALYGLPAGRPFRVIGREGGFAHIQDLKSRASGWIDKSALAEPPRAPAASTPAQPKTYSAGGKPANASAGQKPAATQKDTSVATNSEDATQPDRRRPGLFGGGGLFGGIFGN